jgi:hypothetical protein
MMRVLVAAGLVASGLAVAGCDGGQAPSNVAYPEVRAAVDGGDAAAFDRYKGETVRWTGQVVEARRRFGDDYAEEGVLFVDMDESAESAATDLEPDVTFLIPPSKVPEMTAGEPVTFVAVVREVERGATGERLLRLELKDLED